MSRIVEIEFETEEDERRAGVVRGKMLEERGWKPERPTVMLLVDKDDDVAETTKRFDIAGIPYRVRRKSA